MLKLHGRLSLLDNVPYSQHIPSIQTTHFSSCQVLIEFAMNHLLTPHEWDLFIIHQVGSWPRFLTMHFFWYDSQHLFCGVNHVRLKFVINLWPVHLPLLLRNNLSSHFPAFDRPLNKQVMPIKIQALLHLIKCTMPSTLLGILEVYCLMSQIPQHLQLFPRQPLVLGKPFIIIVHERDVYHLSWHNCQPKMLESIISKLLHHVVVGLSNNSPNTLDHEI